MNEDLLHDAIGQLSQELTEPVGALRRRKKIPWLELCAAAACLCIVIGLGSQGLTARNDDSQEILQEDQETLSETISTICLLATVVEVYDNYLLVSTQSEESGNAAQDSLSTSAFFIEVVLSEETENFSPGDQVKIYYDGIMLERYPPTIPTVYRIEKVK